MTATAIQNKAISLQEGEAAPAFTLPTYGNETVSLSDLAGKYVVLYFYPKDSTPGCTVEANQFTALNVEFAAVNTVIYGVSKDSVSSHEKFRDKQCISFPLLADIEGETCEAYGCWVEKSMYGKKYMGISRDTFLIAPDGTLARIWRKATPKGHAAEVLEAVKAHSAP